jgi:type IV secretory pathway VirB2 component (pilin)
MSRTLCLAAALAMGVGLLVNAPAQADEAPTETARAKISECVEGVISGPDAVAPISVAPGVDQMVIMGFRHQ